MLVKKKERKKEDIPRLQLKRRVLDATDDEPWGPHGSALAEIAQATKKFSECQMVMNVLWTRLGETGRNWRYVYKSLAVIEYLVGNGSERAVDDIVEHTFQISSLASFEYVEPNGKDMGINVRKKAENIVALLNNKDKIQEVRNKAAANREKYFGLSSSGISYKSGSASSGSSSFQSGDKYGGLSGTKDGDTFKDIHEDNDRSGEEKFDQSTSTKSRRAVTSENQGITSKKGSTRYGSKGREISESGASSSATESSTVHSNNYEDDFDDFDPRGTSTAKSAAGNSNKIDLFGQSLVDDLMDAPASVPKEVPTVNSNASEVDLFADATFVSAPPHVEAGGSSKTQTTVDLFASQPASSSAVSSSMDFFAAPDPIGQPDNNSSKSDQMNANAVDPFAAVPLNSFDGSDLFGAFTSNANSASTEPTTNPDGSNNNLNGKSSVESKPPPKKDTFQVKSGIWADSLSRGLIDLNISAPKKVSLSEIGIVGGLTDGSNEKEQGPPPSFYMGRAMGTGSGLGRTGFTSSTGTGSGTGADDMFSNFGSQQYQFGGFK
ncbi:clathrin interactor EPSIN 1-like isoform X2 [Actinidia eriantha]|uniref:clathrin interactor EPSIN 1-like isoform X2 n=1 Tax=Actinidia eriantha TaxID=165200 RepID=UPI0025889027|nr:clathrin interactor EPSIN 1-like isoform X2 [Actinidia eriantha]